MSHDTTLLLTSLEVQMSLYDDQDVEPVELLAHANVAAAVVNEHLRAAKAELARVGVNVNWLER